MYIQCVPLFRTAYVRDSTIFGRIMFPKLSETRESTLLVYADSLNQFPVFNDVIARKLPVVLLRRTKISDLLPRYNLHIFKRRSVLLVF